MFLSKVRELENSILHVLNVLEVSKEKNRMWNIKGENI